jgi:DNA (cytosine-5)-methyltransferase 1
MVDVLTGGFPCQPFSASGKQMGGGDERNMWPETIECVRIIRPQYAFFENVPNLLVFDYIRRIFSDLAESGYDAKWCVLGGYATNSCCESDRLWIVASEANSAMLEGMDFSKIVFSCQKEPCRRQYTRAIGAMLQQDDYARIKRNPNAVAGAMDRLKAIGNGQVPGVVKTAWELLSI